MSDPVTHRKTIQTLLKASLLSPSFDLQHHRHAIHIAQHTRITDGTPEVCVAGKEPQPQTCPRPFSWTRRHRLRIRSRSSWCWGPAQAPTVREHAGDFALRDAGIAEEARLV